MEKTFSQITRERGGRGKFAHTSPVSRSSLTGHRWGVGCLEK